MSKFMKWTILLLVSVAAVATEAEIFVSLTDLILRIAVR